MRIKSYLAILGIMPIVILSCGKDKDDEPTVSNIDIAGEFLGTLTVTGDSAFTTSAEVMAVKQTGTTYILSVFSDEMATVTVSGKSFSGTGTSGSPVTTISGTYDGTAFNFNAKLDDGGTALFSGTKKSNGGGGNADFTIDGIEYSLIAADCFYDNVVYHAIFRLKPLNGSSTPEHVLLFDFDSESMPESGTYDCVFNVPSPLGSFKTIASYHLGSAEADGVYAKSGTVEITNTGESLSISFNNLEFVWDEKTEADLTSPHIVGGSADGCK